MQIHIKINACLQWNKKREQTWPRVRNCKPHWNKKKRMHTHTRTYVHIHVHTRTHAHTHTHPRTRTRTHRHRHRYRHRHARTYTHTHLHHTRGEEVSSAKKSHFFSLVCRALVQKTPLEHWNFIWRTKFRPFFWYICHIFVRLFLVHKCPFEQYNFILRMEFRHTFVRLLCKRSLWNNTLAFCMKFDWRFHFANKIPSYFCRALERQNLFCIVTRLWGYCA